MYHDQALMHSLTAAFGAVVVGVVSVKDRVRLGAAAHSDQKQNKGHQTNFLGL